MAKDLQTGEKNNTSFFSNTLIREGLGANLRIWGVQCIGGYHDPCGEEISSVRGGGGTK